MSGMYLSEGGGERWREREGGEASRQGGSYIACIVVGGSLMWSYYS